MSPNRGTPLVISIVLLLVAACSDTGHSAPPPSRVPTYNFAGIRVSVDPPTVQAIRAAISWSIHPTTSAGSTQSTWIGFYTEPEPQAHVSYKIVQIGWKQLGSGEPHLFWEWSLGHGDSHVSYGDEVYGSQTLQVEIDRVGTSGYSFVLDGTAVDRVTVPWLPALAAASAETHDPADLMAGSSQSPEVVSDVAVKVSNVWHHLGGRTFATDPNYRASLGQPGEIRIWDVRNP